VDREPASFLVVKTEPGVDAESIVRWITTEWLTLDAFSIAGLLEQVHRQLRYFEHFSTILTGISLLVAFLLIGTVLTLSVGERLGELAALRAVGLTRSRAVLLVLLEGVVISAVSAPLALAVGAVISHPLDAILRATPGIPQDLHFFVAGPAPVIRTVLLLTLTGTLGAAHPAWIAGRLNIAATLHQEVQ
jgi:ABC-type antimicrobial peptide transport system permease subunit